LERHQNVDGPRDVFQVDGEVCGRNVARACYAEVARRRNTRRAVRGVWGDVETVSDCLVRGGSAVGQFEWDGQPWLRQCKVMNKILSQRRRQIIHLEAPHNGAIRRYDGAGSIIHFVGSIVSWIVLLAPSIGDKEPQSIFLGSSLPNVHLEEIDDEKKSAIITNKEVIQKSGT
jgi:hypothetical protein